MKTKNKKSKQIRTKRNALIIVGAIVVIGTFAIVRIFASPSSTAAQCSTTRAGVSKNSQPPIPACIAIGHTGGLTYWVDSSKPGKRIHILRINLANEHMYLRASQFDERGKTPTQFARSINALAAINGDFFYPNNNYITNGLAVGNAQQWPFTKDKKTSSFIACTVKNDCFIDSHYTEQKLDPKKYVTVVGGSEILLTPNFHWHLKPNEPGCGAREHTCSAPHPRTAVALSADRKVMWWVVVEGRQQHISGVPLYDLTNILKRLGATWAINLDGGGSSGMVINNTLVNNRPSNDPTERKVGNVLGVVELPRAK